ncbi:MAG TPA: DUF1559 domain-containing protein, partial [Pirellulales bacterium]
AVHNYASLHRSALPQNSSASNDRRLSWATKILPFIEQDGIYQQIDQNQIWAANASGCRNRTLAQTVVPTFVCPSGPRAGELVTIQDPSDSSQTFTAAPGDYTIAGGFYYSTSPANYFEGALRTLNVGVRRLTDLTDGASNTMLFAEIADKTALWRAGFMASGPATKTFNDSNNGAWANPNNNNLRGWDVSGNVQFGPYIINRQNQAAPYAFHPSGAHVLMGDGVVLFLNEDATAEAVKRLVTFQTGDLYTGENS